jgi:glycerophosphoryl diester phosphodiesterase
MNDHFDRQVDQIPVLVAHRGYASRYPENSIIGCEAALELGCRHIEIDIQLSADAVPVLLHDQNLLRTANIDSNIFTIDSSTLNKYDNAEHQRLGPDTPITPIATLENFVALMERWPTAHSFIEIKEESLATFGHHVVIKETLARLGPILSRSIIISYDVEVLRQIQTLASCQTGWVLKRFDTQHRQMANELIPDYLICNYMKLGDLALWPGDWQWMLYEVTDAALALELYRKGAAYIETMAIGELLQDQRFAHYRDKVF